MILIFTIFSSFNFTFQSAVASPPATGDEAFSNATASYTRVSTQNSAWTNTTEGLPQNSTASTIDLSASSMSTGWNGYVWGNYTPLVQSNLSRSYNGIISANGIRITPGHTRTLVNGSTIYSVGSVSVYLVVGTKNYISNFTFNYHEWNTEFYVYVSPTWVLPSYSTSLGTISLDVGISNETGYPYYNAPQGWDTSPNTGTMISTTYYVSGYDAFDYGFSSYPLKYSSTFSLPSNTQSYSFNWSANSNLNVTYNNVNQTGTSGTFTGSLSTMSVSFAFDIGSTNAPSSYILTYHVFATIATIESHTYSEQSYTYSISQNGNYFNSTYLYFNYSVPSGASSSYSISYELKIGNLTLTNPAAPSEYFALPSNTFTYSSVSRYGNTINITAYQNYTSAQSAPVKFDTSEIVNYYPTINYAAVRWTGTGSKAELTVNATTTGGGYTFPSETIQILNINWGDGRICQGQVTDLQFVGDRV